MLPCPEFYPHLTVLGGHLLRPCVQYGFPRKLAVLYKLFLTAVTETSLVIVHIWFPVDFDKTAEIIFDDLFPDIPDHVFVEELRTGISGSRAEMTVPGVGDQRLTVFQRELAIIRHISVTKAVAVLKPVICNGAVEVFRCKNIGKIFPVAVGIVVGHVESEPFHGVDKIFHAVTFPVGTFLRRDESGAENFRLSAGIAGNHFQI